MSMRSNIPPFGKILTTSLLLTALGGGGLIFIILFLEPRLGPRWLFYFFLTMGGTGTALPAIYLIQRRIATQYVSSRVLIREALFFGIFLDLWIWLQIGRIATNLIVIMLAGGLFLVDFLLRLAEKATFKSDDYAEE